MTAQSNKVQPTVYIIGAGLAGTMIAHEIKRKGVFGRVAAFLDDDPQKIGTKTGARADSRCCQPYQGGSAGRTVNSHSEHKSGAAA